MQQHRPLCEGLRLLETAPGLIDQLDELAEAAEYIGLAAFDVDVRNERTDPIPGSRGQAEQQPFQADGPGSHPLVQLVVAPPLVPG